MQTTRGSSTPVRAGRGWDLDRLIGEAAATAARVLGTESVQVLEPAADGSGLTVPGGRWPSGAEPAWAGASLGLTARSPSRAQWRPRSGSRTRRLPSSKPTAARRAASAGRGRLPPVARRRSRGGGRAERPRRGGARQRGRFRELADALPAFMWITDAEGQVAFVNEGWLRFTGRTAEEELGDGFGLSAHPDDRDELVTTWRDCFARREEFRFEYRLARSDGAYRWVLEVGAPRISSGEFVGYVGLATDIHERRAVEEALRESEAGFRELADKAPVMMWTTDPSGLVTFVNAGWLRFTGTSLEEELGDTWTLGVHPEDAPAMLASWDRSVEGAGRRGRPSTGYATAGAVPLDRRPRRSALRGGQFAGHVGTAIDIHQRKTMEAQLEESYLREHRIAETLQRSLPRSVFHGWRASSWRRAISRPSGARPSAATGTTRSSAPTGAWRWWWGTWWATGCAPPRRWASSATRSGRTGWWSRRPRRWWRASTGS